MHYLWWLYASSFKQQAVIHIARYSTPQLNYSSPTCISPPTTSRHFYPSLQNLFSRPYTYSSFPLRVKVVPAVSEVQRCITPAAGGADTWALLHSNLPSFSRHAGTKSSERKMLLKQILDQALTFKGPLLHKSVVRMWLGGWPKPKSRDYFFNVCLVFNYPAAAD